MAPTSALLADVDNFLSLTGMAASTFGRLAVNDGKFVGRLRAGGDVTLTTSRRVYTFIEARQPTTPTEPSAP